MIVNPIVLNINLNLLTPAEFSVIEASGFWVIQFVYGKEKNEFRSK